MKMQAILMGLKQPEDLKSSSYDYETAPSLAVYKHLLAVSPRKVEWIYCKGVMVKRMISEYPVSFLEIPPT